MQKPMEQHLSTGADTLSFVSIVGGDPPNIEKKMVKTGVAGKCRTLALIQALSLSCAFVAG
eukprot:969528-Pelagomonas_calceolata.AAC.1